MNDKLHRNPSLFYTFDIGPLKTQQNFVFIAVGIPGSPRMIAPKKIGTDQNIDA